MPKAEKGTPKDIANRMKARGLQKLKFYCQMCHKQCRDENGFKCHLTSESHLRQMRLFSENSHKMLDQFSKEFEHLYLETLRRRHGTQRMNANNVYQEVIQDKHHIHMNSTKWTTLSDFVQYLGKTSKCVVEETERGWYVTYISRDPIMLAKQKAAQQKADADKAQEERVRKQIELQRKAAAEELDRMGGNLHVEASKLSRQEGDAKLKLDLNVKPSSNKSSSGGAKTRKRGRNEASVLDFEEDDEDDEDNVASSDKNENNENNNKSDHDPKHKSTNNNYSAPKSLEPKHKKRWDSNPPPPTSYKSTSKSTSTPQNKPPLEETQTKKDKKTTNNRKSNWLHTGIYVKIISKKLCKGEYYKRKAIVDKVINKYAAEVEIISTSSQSNDGGDIIQIDQDDLETVIPKMTGKKCRIVNGDGRGCYATVLKLDDKKCRATLQLLEEDERIIEKVDYDDFSKAE